VRKLASRFLRRHGYRVLEAANGGEALLLSERHSGAIDLLLTDVVMPHMTGRMLQERLAPTRPDMKVLFMSGFTDDAVVQHGVDGVSAAFVQKPILPDLLLVKVREVLGSREGEPPARP
jgi:CheY-like chemotaxis protein